jgi:hypothetical protein
MSDSKHIGTRPATAPRGLLFSQVGYDTGDVVRVIVRGDDSIGGTNCVLSSTSEQREAPLEPWGELWGSRWWVADFGRDVPAGKYVVTAGDMLDDELIVGVGRLFDETWKPCAVEAFERRAIFAQDKPAWQDCGSTMQEAYSHALAILGLLDLYEHLGDRAEESWRNRLSTQIDIGLSYLTRLQDLAADLGKPEGAIVHDPNKFKEFVLIPNGLSPHAGSRNLSTNRSSDSRHRPARGWSG